MPKFLTREELYRIFQRELPEDVYADGAPSGHYTTASIDSKSEAVAQAYSNLETIYDNYFPETSVEKIDDWVFKVFGYLFDPTTTLEEKRERVIAKIRKQPTITQWEIQTLVAAYLPEGTYSQVYSPCGEDRFWTLGVSLLGINTFLAGLTIDDLGIPSSEWCEELANMHWRLGVDALGFNTYLSEFLYTEVAQVQANAYLYEIRIFGYTLSASDRERLIKEIKQTEPARSSFRLYEGLDLNDYGLTNIVAEVDQFTLVDTITRDTGSSTGYSGLTVL